MWMNSRGALSGDTSCMVDPHKIGRILWSRTKHGYLVPVDLHNKIHIEDEHVCDKICTLLLQTRQVRAALNAVYDHDWIGFRPIKPYLRMSMDGRMEARSMIASGEWDQFWGDSDDWGVKPKKSTD